MFRGAGWNVIKVLWGSEWDDLLARDTDGLLVKRMGEVVDGEYQRYVVEDGAYLRKHFWGADPRLLEMVRHLSDDELKKLRVGGHDPVKVYNAYPPAVHAQGRADGDPRAHDQGLRPGRGRRRQEHHAPAEEDERGGPARPSAIASASRFPTIGSPMRRSTGPPRTAPKCSTCSERRQALGGAVPRRVVAAPPITADARGRLRGVLQGHRRPQGVDDDGVREDADEAAARQGDRQAHRADRSRRSAHVRHGVALPRRSASTRASASSTSRSTWRRCCTTRKRRTGRSSKRASPRPDRSRRASPPARPTRRTASTRFRSSSSIRCSASSASATSSGPPPTRAAAGFLLGGTAGRTTLAGEGLQHQDGHSHMLALTVPTCRAYDPAYAFELAAIIQDGIKRMYGERRDGASTTSPS